MEKRNLDRRGALNLSTIGLFAAAGIIAIITAAMDTKVAEGGWAEFLWALGKLQDFITQNYYTCTDEILAGLGKMYVADERFKKNIDKYGEGTAEFAAEAIAIKVGA